MPRKELRLWTHLSEVEVPRSWAEAHTRVFRCRRMRARLEELQVALAPHEGEHTMELVMLDELRRIRAAACQARDDGLLDLDALRREHEAHASGSAVAAGGAKGGLGTMVRAGSVAVEMDELEEVVAGLRRLALAHDLDPEAHRDERGSAMGAPASVRSLWGLHCVLPRL